MARSTRNDLPAVEVEYNNVGKAIKRFCNLWKSCGIVGELRFRQDHPSRADRKREKRRIAVRRLKRAHKRAMAG